MRISNEYTKDTAGSEAVDRPKPQQGLRQIFETVWHDAINDNPDMSEKEFNYENFEALIEQTLHDCLPEKLTDKSDETGELIRQAFNACIDQTQDNLKRRMEDGIVTDQEIDMNETVDVEIKVSNGWWSLGVMTAANAEKVIQYAGSLVGETAS